MAGAMAEPGYAAWKEFDMATIYGNTYANTLKGTAYADILYGRAGNDFLYGYAGNDTLNGGTGETGCMAVLETIRTSSTVLTMWP